MFNWINKKTKANKKEQKRTSSPVFKRTKLFGGYRSGHKCMADLPIHNNDSIDSINSDENMINTSANMVALDSFSSSATLTEPEVLQKNQSFEVEINKTPRFYSPRYENVRQWVKQTTQEDLFTHDDNKDDDNADDNADEDDDCKLEEVRRT